ncbi:MAG: anhydro-N-acetylmuramic acid kinase [Microcoleaceae cyanobacterium]
MNQTINVVGLISGTSVDGIDAALVQIEHNSSTLQVKLLAGNTFPYPDILRSQILAVCQGEALSMAELAALDHNIAICFAEAANAIQKGQPAAQLIGSHGQTVFHQPPQLNSPQFQMGYSLQLGRGAAIAQLTAIPTVSNFRQADLEAGGEGAPLVSAVDIALLTHPQSYRCVQNLGGIGNVTYLPPLATQGKILGWDTGPANSLLDLAVEHFSNGNQTYDKNGAIAATGTPCLELVQQWLQQDFFHQPPPKSTGRELFGLAYLHQCLTEAQNYDLNSADILATLTELTAASIAQSYHQFLPQMPDQVLLCGGGSHNSYLKQRLQHHLDPIPILTTTDAGLDADYKEAIAFAILAYWRMNNITGNCPAVTGAKQAVLLGEIHQP